MSIILNLEFQEYRYKPKMFGQRKGERSILFFPPEMLEFFCSLLVTRNIAMLETKGKSYPGNGRILPPDNPLFLNSCDEMLSPTVSWIGGCRA